MPDATAVEQLSFGSNSPDDSLPMTRCLASGVRAPTAWRAGGCGHEHEHARCRHRQPGRLPRCASLWPRATRPTELISEGFVCKASGQRSMVLRWYVVVDYFVKLD